jgi:4,5-DOPA dioxygenase extradiol
MEWAMDFDDKIKKNFISKNHMELIKYQSMGKVANIGIPTWDHYLPMIYAIALQDKGESITFFYEGFQYGSISMRCFRIG